MAVQRTLIGNIKGPKGDKGDTGDTGARGAAGTISVGSVTTTAYGGSASVTNSGTSTDAVFDFVIPQGRPGEQVTDMQDLTLSSLTQPSTQFPTPSIGDTGKVIFGKITKWFSDMKALVATKLNAANVVNNLTTTASGYALDARMGKTLQDRITSLNDSSIKLYGWSDTFLYENTLPSTTVTSESVTRYGNIFMLRLKIVNGASAIAPWANVADLTLLNASIKYIVGDGISGGTAFTPVFISPTRFIIRNTGATAFAANDSAFVNVSIGI